MRSPEAIAQHYMLGLPVQDAEHSSLIDCLHTLAVCDTTEKYDSIAMRLLSLWETHATHEEEFMRDINFPFIHHHISSHVEVSRTIKFKLYSASKITSLGHTRLLAADIEEVILHHSDMYDRLYADHYRSLK